MNNFSDALELCDRLAAVLPSLEVSNMNIEALAGSDSDLVSLAVSIEYEVSLLDRTDSRHDAERMECDGQGGPFLDHEPLLVGKFGP